MTNAAEPLFVDTNVRVYAAWSFALLHGVRRLLTNNPRHFAAFAQMVTILPL